MFKLKSAWVQACAFRSLGGTNGVVASGGMDNIVTLFSLRMLISGLVQSASLAKLVYRR